MNLRRAGYPVLEAGTAAPRACGSTRPRPIASRRTRLLDNVLGDHVYIEERTVDVHIRRLRLALSPGGHDRLIETVRGGGYRFLPR